MKREILPLPGKIAGKAPQPEPLSQEEQRSDQKQRPTDDHQDFCQADHAGEALQKTSGFAALRGSGFRV